MEFQLALKQEWNAWDTLPCGAVLQWPIQIFVCRITSAG